MKDNSFFNQLGNFYKIKQGPLPNPLQQIKPQTQYHQKQQQPYYNQGKQNNQIGSGKKQYTKHQLQQFQQFQKELEYDQQSQQQQKNQLQQQQQLQQQSQQQQYQMHQLQQQQKSNLLYYPNTTFQGVNIYNPLPMHNFPPLYVVFMLYSLEYIRITITSYILIIYHPHATLTTNVFIILLYHYFYYQPQYRMPDVMLHYPPITTMTPMQHEIDWFYGKEGWRMFDSRRCNLIENMMHHNTQSEFELIYRDSKSIVNFRAMTFYDTQEECLYKLRRETPICSKIIRIGQGTWSFYNGLTWIQYDRMVIVQLEEKLRHGEIHFTIYADGKEFSFDLDQNVQVCDTLPLGKGDRKIITRQWMTMQQLQDIGRMKKHQEQVYIEERKKLEDRVKQHIIQKKAMQTSMKQQQRQYWNQMKKSSQQQSVNPHPNLLSDSFNLKELDLGIGKNQHSNIFQDLPKINLTEGKVGQILYNHDQYIQMMNQNFVLQDLSIESIHSSKYQNNKGIQESDITFKVLKQQNGIEVLEQELDLSNNQQLVGDKMNYAQKNLDQEYQNQDQDKLKDQHENKHEQDLIDQQDKEFLSDEELEQYEDGYEDQDNQDLQQSDNQEHILNTKPQLNNEQDQVQDSKYNNVDQNLLKIKQLDDYMNIQDQQQGENLTMQKSLKIEDFMWQGCEVVLKQENNLHNVQVLNSPQDQAQCQQNQYQQNQNQQEIDQNEDQIRALQSVENQNQDVYKNVNE